MRIKSHWFKSGRERTAQEIADALAFIVWRIGDNALKNTRKADFEIEVGPQYFAFLVEFLLFLIQAADRIAYRRLSAEDRFVFTSTLANRIAETYAENHSRLQSCSSVEAKQHFINLLNQRADGYADFDYSEDGPSFKFTRHLGYCMEQVMGEQDSNWIIDQMMSIAAPEAVQMLEKTIRDLYEAEPRPARRRAAVGAD